MHAPALTPTVSAPWLRRLGAGLLVVTGIGHLATEALGPRTPEREAIVRTLQSIAMELPGTTRSLWAFHHGLSVMMGALLVACGALIAAAPGGRRDGALALAMAAFAAYGAWRWFFVVPGVLTTGAALCFGAQLILELRRRVP